MNDEPAAPPLWVWFLRRDPGIVPGTTPGARP